jgi:hypothetical protein
VNAFISHDENPDVAAHDSPPSTLNPTPNISPPTSISPEFAGLTAKPDTRPPTPGSPNDTHPDEPDKLAPLDAVSAAPGACRPVLLAGENVLGDTGVEAFGGEAVPVVLIGAPPRAFCPALHPRCGRFPRTVR